jgi:hypothetical protein
MRVKITKPCVIEVLAGSEVEVTEYQLKFIREFCEPIETRETPEKAQKTTRKARK